MTQALQGPLPDDLSWIAGEGGPSAHKRVQVYQRSVRNRLSSCLADDFPRVKALLGERAFDALVSAYLRRHPPNDPALRNLGARFAAFVGAEWTGAPPGLAQDLARLEWAWTEVFDGPDEATLTREVLAQVPAERWAGLRLRPISAHFVGVFGYPVHSFDPDQPEKIPSRGPVRILMWRQNLRVFLRPLSVSEAITLEALRARLTFAQLGSVSSGEDEPVEAAAARVVGYLQRWIDDGLLAAFEVDAGSAPPAKKGR